MVAEGAGTTRAQIVDAANRLFSVKGFEHTSFAAIAETVGISRGTFYQAELPERMRAKAKRRGRRV
ncbi:TetR family transcriptional regulator [Streptomyces sp. NPDC005828]|uniref:TetR family transcriptional regulator n=1 Tax=Streptomyces sp. NPDC005828 TaxID=3157071 RepID=UPI00340BAA3E